MTRYRLIALDIDGTITVNRSSTTLCIEVIEALRKARSRGMIISFVSSNALPIVVGLERYLGLEGPAAGETGALVYLDRRVYHLTKYSTRKVLEDVIDKFGEYVTSSWQNLFRIYDSALNINEKYRGDVARIYTMVKEYVTRKYSNVKVGYSGYAIHLTPIDIDKGKALRFILNKLGIDRDETIGVGDSYMDLDFIRETGLKVAVNNADEELKNNVDLVLNKPSGYGVVELIEKIIRKEY